jgi:hypothetical protein
MFPILIVFVGGQNVERFSTRIPKSPFVAQSKGAEMKRLTPKEVMTYPQFPARKTAPTKIRSFTEEDVENVRGEFQQDAEGTFFLDLENRRQKVEVGRCLCVGTSPQDRWTSSQKRVDQERVAVGPADEAGFRRYVMKNPTRLTCFDIGHPFALDNEDGKEAWECQDPSGGYITWNRVTGQGSIMRVVQRTPFDATYERE